MSLGVDDGLPDGLMLGSIDTEGEPDGLVLGTEDNNSTLDVSSLCLNEGPPDGSMLG